MNRAEMKKKLKEFIEEETKLFSKVLADQMSTLAFMCGIYNKTTDLAFQETDDKICCADVSVRGDQTVVYWKKTLTVKDNKESERSEHSSSFSGRKESGYPTEQSLNKASPPYTTIRYDMFSRGWAIDSQGAVHPCEINTSSSRVIGYKKMLSSLLSNEPNDKSMVQCRLRVTSLRQDDAHQLQQKQPRGQALEQQNFCSLLQRRPGRRPGEEGLPQNLRGR